MLKTTAQNSRFNTVTTVTIRRLQPLHLAPILSSPALIVIYFHRGKKTGRMTIVGWMLTPKKDIPSANSLNLQMWLSLTCNVTEVKDFKVRCNSLCLGKALNPMTSVLKRGRQKQTWQTELPRGGVKKIQTDTEVMHQKAKECQGLLATTKNGGVVSILP